MEPFCLCLFLRSFTPAEYAAGAADGYRLVDAHPAPTLPGADWFDLTKAAEIEIPATAISVILSTAPLPITCIPNSLWVSPSARRHIAAALEQAW